MKVALFATCLGDQFFADACADSVRLLRHVVRRCRFLKDRPVAVSPHTIPVTEVKLCG